MIISYNEKELNSKIALPIKFTKISQLVIGAHYEDGDIKDLSICKFIQEDKYGNNAYSLSKSTTGLNSYIIGKFIDGFNLIIKKDYIYTYNMD